MWPSRRSPLIGRRRSYNWRSTYTTLDKNDITNQLRTACSTHGAHMDFSTLRTVELSIKQHVSTTLQGTYQMLFKCCTQVTWSSVCGDRIETVLFSMLCSSFGRWGNARLNVTNTSRIRLHDPAIRHRWWVYAFRDMHGAKLNWPTLWWLNVTSIAS